MKNAKTILIASMVVISMMISGFTLAEEATSTPIVDSPEATATSTPPDTPPPTATSTPSDTPPPTATSTQSTSTSTATSTATSTPVAGESATSTLSETASEEEPILEPMPEPEPEPEVPPDSQPPGRISDVSLQWVSAKSADISWRAPSDNDEVAGYDFRISLNPITESNWNETIQLSGGSKPKNPGEKEVVGLTDLPSGKTIYFAVRSFDRAGNMSEISNVLEFTTRQNQNQETGIRNQESVSANPAALTPKNAGTVRLVLQTPEGGVPDDLIFVNFVNTANGLSFGGMVIDGILAIGLPEGNYRIKMILPANFEPPLNLPLITVSQGEDVDLGVLRLREGIGGSDFLASVEAPGGIGRALAFIIQLLFEILRQLKEILAKL